MNHFKTALNDPEVMEQFKDKPYHMAVLYALSEYTEQGHRLSDLPWFSMCKSLKEKECGRKTQTDNV